MMLKLIIIWCVLAFASGFRISDLQYTSTQRASPDSSGSSLDTEGRSSNSSKFPKPGISTSSLKEQSTSSPNTHNSNSLQKQHNYPLFYSPYPHSGVLYSNPYYPHHVYRPRPHSNPISNSPALSQNIPALASHEISSSEADHSQTPHTETHTQYHHSDNDEHPVASAPDTITKPFNAHHSQTTIHPDHLYEFQRPYSIPSQNNTKPTTPQHTTPSYPHVDQQVSPYPIIISPSPYTHHSDLENDHYTHFSSALKPVPTQLSLQSYHYSDLEEHRPLHSQPLVPHSYHSNDLENYRPSSTHPFTKPYALYNSPSSDLENYRPSSTHSSTKPHPLYNSHGSDLETHHPAGSYLSTTPHQPHIHYIVDLENTHSRPPFTSSSQQLSDAENYYPIPTYSTAEPVSLQHVNRPLFHPPSKHSETEPNVIYLTDEKLLHYLQTPLLLRTLNNQQPSELVLLGEANTLPLESQQPPVRRNLEGADLRSDGPHVLWETTYRPLKWDWKLHSWKFKWPWVWKWGKKEEPVHHHVDPHLALEPWDFHTHSVIKHHPVFVKDTPHHVFYPHPHFDKYTYHKGPWGTQSELDRVSKQPNEQITNQGLSHHPEQHMPNQGSIYHPDERIPSPQHPLSSHDVYNLLGYRQFTHRSSVPWTQTLNWKNPQGRTLDVSIPALQSSQVQDVDELSGIHDVSRVKTSYITGRSNLDVPDDVNYQNQGRSQFYDDKGEFYQTQINSHLIDNADDKGEFYQPQGNFHLIDDTDDKGGIYQLQGITHLSGERIEDSYTSQDTSQHGKESEDMHQSQEKSQFDNVREEENNKSQDQPQFNIEESY